MSAPIFTSGTARGGTNLRAQVLSAHKAVRLASDPFLPLFKELRNSILRKTNDSEIHNYLNPTSPLDDYYFSTVKARALKCILHAQLEKISFSVDDWTNLKNSQARRMSLASADLIPLLDMLPAENYRKVFEATLRMVERARKGEGCSWVGFNDNWAVEFFPALANAFPEARFMIFLRDPRGAVDGALHAETDPAKIPHVLSFSRHWRKYVAFISHLRRDPLFKDRLYISTFESLISNPEKAAMEMCEFLGIQFEPAMLQTENFRTALGEKWPATWDIYRDAVTIWERRLLRPILEVVEFICHADMQLYGYHPVQNSGFGKLSSEAIQFIENDSRNCQGWRSDFAELEKDIGFEFWRQNVLSTPRGVVQGDAIEKGFLFSEVYDFLKEHSIEKEKQ